MICPLGTQIITVQSKFGVTPQSILFECPKEKCSWWLSSGKCAVTQLAESQAYTLPIEPKAPFDTDGGE
jgi:hypothetical protein